MNKIKHLYLFGVLFLSAYLPLNAQNIPCDHPDYNALVAIYNATDGDNWTQKWDLSDCDVCTWFGIGCDPLTNRVDEILLPDNNLVGELPSKIGDIRYLTRLELPNNQLTGTIPIEIEKLTPVLGFIFGLRFIALQNNQLSGPIPTAIGNLSGGSILNLANNNFTGTLPDNLANFGNEAGLNILRINVDNNQLTGCFPSNLDKFCPGDAFVSFSAIGNDDLPNGGDFVPFCELGNGNCNTTAPQSCEAIQFIGATNQISISGLTLSSKVEIIGRNTDYQTIVICEDDCSDMQLIPDLVAGTYTVKVNLFDGTNYCYREESVMVEGDDNNKNDGKADCNNLVFTGEEGQITIEGLNATANKVEIIGRNTDWQVLTICDGDCAPTQIIPDLEMGEYRVKINQSGNGGSYCYREESVVVTGAISTNGTANCEDLIFESGSESITVNNLTADYNKVEIIGRNTAWQVLTICDDDCSTTQIIPDLAEGVYTVKVNQAGGDGSYCYIENELTVDNSSNNRNNTIDYSDQLVLFPNPATNRVNIQLPANSRQKGVIQIYTIYGQLLSTTSISDRDIFAIDLSDFENGMYVATIQIGGVARFSQRFVVEHLR